MTAPASHPFLAACRGESTGHTPVWFMRQAGRSLPEYRAVRGEGSILDAIAKPELAAEISLQPVRRYGVDAAVLFSDIVVPSHAVGFGIDITPGTGPVADRPLRTAADLDPLVDRVGGARFVCIGEASHGTHEYYRWRALLSRRLIEERGFTWIGVEGD